MIISMNDKSALFEEMQQNTITRVIDLRYLEKTLVRILYWGKWPGTTDYSS